MNVSENLQAGPKSLQENRKKIGERAQLWNCTTSTTEQI